MSARTTDLIDLCAIIQTGAYNLRSIWQQWEDVNVDLTDLSKTRLYYLRAKFKNDHPYLMTLPKLSRERQLAVLIREHIKPKYWRVRFGANSQRRQSWLLYQAAIKLAAKQWRRDGRRQDARQLEAHLATLIDAAPRLVYFYDSDWKLISKALRPHGSAPQKGRSQQLYSVYQWIIRNRVEE